MIVLLCSLAWATPSITSGRYVLDEPMVNAEKRRAVAKQATLDSTNFIVRALAGDRLEGMPNICAAYLFTQIGSTLEVTCDSQPKIDVKLDGTPSIYPKKEGGGTHAVTALVDGNVVSQTFAGANGAFVVSWTFLADRIEVRKSLDSSYFGRPLVLDLPYRLVK